jgi:hypothetical protein
VRFWYCFSITTHDTDPTRDIPSTGTEGRPFVSREPPSLAQVSPSLVVTVLPCDFHDLYSLYLGSGGVRLRVRKGILHGLAHRLPPQLRVIRHEKLDIALTIDSILMNFDAQDR